MEKLADEINAIEKAHEQNFDFEELMYSGKTADEVQTEYTGRIKTLTEENTTVKEEMEEILQAIKFYSDNNEELDKVSKKIKI